MAALHLARHEQNVTHKLINTAMALGMIMGANFCLTDGVKSTDATAQVINVESVPEHLPMAIADKAKTVFKDYFQYFNVRLSPGDTPSTGYATATALQIAPNEYITAGHMLYGENDQALGGTHDCANIFINTTSPQHRQGERLTVTKFAGSFHDHDTTNVPDIALLQTMGTGAKVDGSQLIRLSNQPVREGQVAYFENWEETANGDTRDPIPYNPDSVFDSAMSIPWHSVTTIAKFAGVVYGREANGDIEIADGFRTYDRQNDNSLLPGGSGGPVFDAQGNLIGISVRYGPIHRSDDIASFEHMTSTLFTHLPSRQKFIGSAIVQPITPELLAHYQAALSAEAACRIRS